MPIVALEKLFNQLEPWGQDPEDRRFGDLSDCVLSHLKWVLEEAFELEAKQMIGCAFYERSDARRDYRNGYRTRDILTRFGMLKGYSPRWWCKNDGGRAGGDRRAKRLCVDERGGSHQR